MSINVLSHLSFKHGTNLPANIWWTQIGTANLGRGPCGACHSASLLQRGLPWPHRGAWARWCLFNCTLPWKTCWQAKEGDVPFFRASPLLIFSFFCFSPLPAKATLVWLVKLIRVPRPVVGLRCLCLHAQLVCLSWYLLAVSFLLSPAHKSAAVKFKQQSAARLPLVPAVPELKSPGWTYWAETHRQRTSATNRDANSGFCFSQHLPVPPLQCCSFVFPSHMLRFAVALLAFPLLPSPSPPLLYQMQHFSVTDWQRMQQLRWRRQRGEGRERKAACDKRGSRNTERWAFLQKQIPVTLC